MAYHLLNKRIEREIYLGSKKGDFDILNLRAFWEAQVKLSPTKLEYSLLEAKFIGEPFRL
jgi:hypothetical protein